MATSQTQPRPRNQYAANNGARDRYQYQQQQYAPQQASCFAQGWKDITTSPGWIKRELLLMLMGALPVINVYVDGYNLEWGADAAKGNRNPLPKGSFSKRTFITGLFYLIMSVLFIIANAWTAAIGFIPLVGWIFTFVIGLFANSFFMLSSMRMALKEKLGAAFDLSKIFSVYKRNLGSLVGAAVLPGIIVTVIIVLVTALIIGLIILSMGVGAYSMLNGYSSGYYMNPMSMFGVAGAGIVGVIVVIALALMLYNFFMTFANTWACRSVGIWVERNAKEWVEED